MNKSTSKIIAGPAAFLVIVLFFMPYITVSCSGTEISATGYELATGTTAETNSTSTSSQEMNNEIILFVIPIMGAVALAALATSSNTPKAAYILSGLGGLAVQVYKLLDYQSQVSNAREQGVVVNINYEIAWWLTMGALLAILVVGLTASSESPSNIPAGRSYGDLT